MIGIVDVLKIYHEICANHELRILKETHTHRILCRVEKVLLWRNTDVRIVILNFKLQTWKRFVPV